MTNLWHYKAVSGVTNTISQFSYGYDSAGNRVWVKRASGKGDVYQYDPTDQLTNVLYEATTPDATPSGWTNEVRYVFDAAGNRTSVTRTNSGTISYTANALNQYTAVGGVALGWDANGNPTNVVENGVTLSLTYDRENRLMRADTGTVTVTNTYDAFHRLVERATAAGKLRFVYDNRWRVIAEYDGNDTLVNKYVYGPEIDEPVRLTRSGSRFYYHAAALGTVTELTGFLGNVRETYTYDVYGQPTLRNNVGTVITASQFGNRFLFQGRDRDPDTGLYNFRYRTYSATLGRFLQVDPIRSNVAFGLNPVLSDDLLNNYAFLRNSPQNALDPMGLNPILRTLIPKSATQISGLVFGPCSLVGVSFVAGRLPGYMCVWRCFAYGYSDMIRPVETHTTWKWREECSCPQPSGKDSYGNKVVPYLITPYDPATYGDLAYD
jgi:RHS repeat-associated protein